MISMQVVIVAFAAFILGVGILANNSESSVLGEQITDPTSTPEITEEPSPSATPVETTEPTGNPSTELRTSQPTAQPTELNNLSSFVYPNSTIEIQNNLRIELSTSESANTVTDWYRAKMKEQNFSINTAVKTSSNGVVSNKLGGGNDDVNIDVNISQSGSSETSVIVRKL